MLTFISMVKHIIEKNTASDNVSYMVDNEKCLCQHENLHPLTAIKGKWVSGTMYKDIESKI